LAMPYPDELRLVGIALGNDSLERASSSFDVAKGTFP